MNCPQKLFKLSLTLFCFLILSIMVSNSHNLILAFKSTNPNQFNNTLATHTSALSVVITINPGADDSKSQHPYNQSKVTIPIGTNVTWLNNDSIGHHLVSGDPVNGPSNIFYSPYLNSKESFTFIFTKPGIFPYYDTYFPHMQGQVEVVESIH